MKLHPALKDPEMKHPRLANALLDVGMILIIVSSIGLLFTIFYWGVGQYMSGGFLALIAGALFVARAKQVAKMRRHQSIDEGRPTLRRVK
ncbi:hypothetical protein P245_20865 [Comamonas thiooxydans]|uniref:Uncharacterized protein n=1 Tax=Comamonas thiooxydans TaxID=363952 RepID=A0A0E3B9R0_9BURK|nr:hypothetical protein [Comamonas thiooxydans]KGG86172.1 hypothetical protein P245_20865 [Comamonas thiooxydans]